MSYLNSPSLVFTGDFKSDVSTVNNDPTHYNNATFVPSFQEPGQGATNGWWNPEGGASFSFQNCTVQQMIWPAETVGIDAATDIVLTLMICDAGDRTTGKMVDLDPQEQMTSQLWSVSLCLKTSAGELLLQGDVVKAPGFRDLQMRQTDGGAANGQPLGGTWTSVLENLTWGPKALDSPFLKELQNVTQGNKLSLNLHGFGYYYNHAPDGRFSMGKIIGTIGPWFESEPYLFAPVRRLYGILQQGAGGPIFYNISSFAFDKDRRRLSLDVGGSFPVADALGTVATGPALLLGVSKKSISAAPDSTPVVLSADDFTEIGPLNYTAGDWLMKTGGIVNFDNLPDDVLTALESNQLLLLTPGSADGTFAVVAREAIDGYYVKADEFVQRIDTGETKEIGIFAYQYGKTLTGRQIDITLSPPTPATPFGPPPNGDPISDIPSNNVPPSGLTFLPSTTTGPDGRASFSVTGNPINTPRGYMDGQIYFLDYQINNINNDPAESANMSQENIFIHLRDYFPVIANPAWSDISQIMTQYSNLYPIMSKYLVNLSDPVAVKSKSDILIFAFTRPIEDSAHMPVTRDLSEGKRRTILNFLGYPAGAPDPAPADMTEASPQAVSASEPQISSARGAAENQRKFKNATQQKGGASASTDKVDDLFKNI